MAERGVAKEYRQLNPILMGDTPATDLKLGDSIPVQHFDDAGGVNTYNKINVARTFCVPYAEAGNPNSGVYYATCQNYPDFSLTFLDANNQPHTLVGMKIRVKFNAGITYGSVSGGTFPTLSINNQDALPLLAQGKTMANGSASAGQTLEFTLIPYGNSYAWDADSNVRESTSDYTIYTDGATVYNKTGTDENFVKKQYLGNQGVTVSDKEYTLSSRYGLIYIRGYKTDGNGYCQIYLLSTNPRQNYVIATLLASGGESPINNSIITSNYNSYKIKVSTGQYYAYVYGIYFD